jgi:hypothetical protein
MNESVSKRGTFGLRTLLLLVVIACLAIGLYVVGSRLSDANRELRTRRTEAGVLTVDDRSKVHAIAVDTGEPNTWRWRLFIPQGRKYSWNISAEDIPKDDVPSRAGAKGYSNEEYWSRDNEVVVTAKLRQLDGGDWQMSVDSLIADSPSQMHGATLQIPQEKLRWMAEISSTDGRVAGERGVRVFEEKEPLILLQRRPCEQQPDGTYQPSEKPMPGFMIWLKEE